MAAKVGPFGHNNGALQAQPKMLKMHLENFAEIYLHFFAEIYLQFFCGNQFGEFCGNSLGILAKIRSVTLHCPEINFLGFFLSSLC